MTMPLLLIAGTSEAGKSTAGLHLSQRGIYRVKIRTILTSLTTGRPDIHEGVPVRVDFDPAEFCDHVRNLSVPIGYSAAAIESFIDVDLATATRAAWPASCRLVFITATRTRRLDRLIAATGLTPEGAATKLDGKDARKNVAAQLDQWRALADDWIDNDSTHAAYLARLDLLADLLLTRPGKEPQP